MMKQKMKWFGILVGVGLASVILLALTLLFSATVQRAIVLQILARQVDTVELASVRLSPSLSALQVSNLRVIKDGVEIELESAQVQGALLKAIVSHTIELDGIEIKGLKVVLAAIADDQGGAGNDDKRRSSSTSPTELKAMFSEFEGLLTDSHFPLNLTLNKLGVEAQVLMADARMIEAQVQGRGIAPGARAALNVVGTFKDERVQADVSSMALQGTIQVDQTAGRSISAIELDIALAATSSRLDLPARLHVVANVQRDAGNESYALTLDNITQAGKLAPIIAVNGAYDTTTQTLTGDYRIHARSEDVQPFALNLPVPQFELKGEGQLRYNTARGQGDVDAQLQLNGEGFEVIDARLAPLGYLEAMVQFAVGIMPEAVLFKQGEAKIEQAGQASLAVDLLAPLALNAQALPTLKHVPAGDVLALTLKHVPLAWVDPWVDGYGVAEGTVSANLRVLYEQGTWRLYAGEDIQLSSVTITQGQQQFVEQFDFSALPSAQLRENEVTVEIQGIRVRQRGTTLLQGEVTAQLDQSSAGSVLNTIACNVQADLAALNAQLFNQAYELRTGHIALQGSYHLQGQQAGAVEVQGTLTKLATNRADLGDVSRLEFSAKGTVLWPEQMKLKMPVKLLGKQRVSDCVFEVSGSQRNGQSIFDVAVGGESLHVDDFMALHAMFVEEGSATSDAVHEMDVFPTQNVNAAQGAIPDAVPVWAGYGGTVAVNLGQLSALHHEVEELQTSLSVKSDAVVVHTLRGNYLGADVDGSATLTFFRQTTAAPYALVSKLSIEQLDTKKLLQRVSSEANTQLNGLFDVQLNAHGRGPNIKTLLKRIQGDFDLRGDSGSLVLLANKKRLRGFTKMTSLLAGGVGQFLDLLDVEINEIDALIQLINLLEKIDYEHVRVRGVRDSSLDITLEEMLFSGTSIRLEGSGKIMHQARSGLSDNLLRIQALLSAKGKTAELFDKVGWTSGPVGEDGFFPGLAFVISGTIGKPNVQQVMERVQRAIDKVASFGLKGSSQQRESDNDNAQATQQKQSQKLQVDDVLRGVIDILGR